MSLSPPKNNGLAFVVAVVTKASPFLNYYIGALRQWLRRMVISFGYK